jgi:hypothetical protein
MKMMINQCRKKLSIGEVHITVNHDNVNSGRQSDQRGNIYIYNVNETAVVWPVKLRRSLQMFQKNILPLSSM